MIILLLVQLLLGTLIALGLYGQLLILGQRLIRPHRLMTFHTVTTIITVIFYCMIAYYYSDCVDIYANKHNGRAFASILSFLMLTFLLYGPAKYTDTNEQRGLILISGTIAIAFYIVIRFFPEIGNSIMSWLPVFIWV